MRLAVIIPAYNAAADVENLLWALRPQLAYGDECIVVDDGSSDGTGMLAERSGVRVIRKSACTGPADARNLGAQECSGDVDVLVFLDSDVTPHRDTLERIRDRFDQMGSSLHALMGSYDDQPAHLHPVSVYRNLLHCYTHRQGKPEANTFWAGCGAIRREVFLAAGGFNAGRYRTPSIEDIELGMRLREAGKRILLDPQIQVQHRKRWTFSSMVHTDIWRRAVPWAELLLQRRGSPGQRDLNLSLSQRLSTGLMLVALAGLGAAAVSPDMGLITAGALALVAALNADFYWFLAVQRGWFFAFRSFPLHLLYFLYCACGLLIAVLRQTPAQSAEFPPAPINPRPLLRNDCTD